MLEFFSYPPLRTEFWLFKRIYTLYSTFSASSPSGLASFYSALLLRKRIIKSIVVRRLFLTLLLYGWILPTVVKDRERWTVNESEEDESISKEREWERKRQRDGKKNQLWWRTEVYTGEEETEERRLIMLQLLTSAGLISSLSSKLLLFFFPFSFKFVSFRSSLSVIWTVNFFPHTSPPTQ